MLMLDTDQVITFDCYGTLVQWHRALADAVSTILRRLGGDGAAERTSAVVERLRAEAFRLQSGADYRPYKAVLAAALEASFASEGLRADSHDVSTLIAALSAIPPHPDTAVALHRLAGRYRLAVISNTDDDLIAGTIRLLGAPLDHVVTAEQARAYKPDHRLFIHAHQVLGTKREKVIHVGMGQYTDLKACHELGIRSIWINRAGEAPDPRWPADLTLPDLTPLPDVLGCSSASSARA